MEIWVGLALVLVGAAFALRWWLDHPRPAILGRDDLSNSIHQVLRWADDGGRFVCTAVDQDAVVSLKRLDGSGQDVKLEIELASRRVDQRRMADLSAELKSLGVSQLSRPVSMPDDRGRDTWRVTAHLPANAMDCGLMADLLLRAAGLTENDRYGYRFEGSMNADRLRQDAIKRTHVAGAMAPREWQASLLRRMSRSLRVASKASRRGRGMKDREPRR